MAEIAGVFAVSHTPVMTNLPEAPGAEVSGFIYEQFRRIGAEIEALSPDALLLISDDHLHNFFLGNMPAFCIGLADSYEGPVEGWLKVERRRMPGARPLAAHILQHCFDAGFDPSFSLDLTLDHGMVTPLELSGLAGKIPAAPLLVNCVQPPLPRMNRCIALGQAIGDAIRSFGELGRVAVLATGGISHDVGTPRMGFVNTEFDHEFLRLLQDGAPEPLAAFSEAQVDTAGNGAEEIRNWLVAHGITGCSPFDLYHYAPVSEWYTGIALGKWTAA